MIIYYYYYYYYSPLLSSSFCVMSTFFIRVGGVVLVDEQTERTSSWIYCLQVVVPGVNELRGTVLRNTFTFRRDKQCVVFTWWRCWPLLPFWRWHFHKQLFLVRRKALTP